MNRKLIAVLAATTMAGAAGFSAIASAEATLYGSVRAGIVSGDDDGADSSNRLDFGATGNDGSIGGQGLYSRLGFKGETDLGNGMSAGLKIERGIGDTLSTRHTNVFVGGGWGTLTLGQQDNVYRPARNWDQTYFLGGQFGDDGGSRVEGVRYDTSSGPFSLSVMAEANDASDDEAEAEMFHYFTAVPTGSGAEVVEEDDLRGQPQFIPAGTNSAATCSAISATSGSECAQAYTIGGDADTDGTTDPATASSITRTPAESNDGVDAWAINAGYDFGVVNLGVSHRTTEVGAFDNTAVGINGSAGAIDWYLAYQTASDNADDGVNDTDSIGGFVSFDMSERNKIYAYHVQHEADDAGATAFGDDELGQEPTETIVGYSHSFGGGVTFIGEYLKMDKDTDKDGSDPSVLVLALKVDF